jgi:hypothetical protein
MLLYVHDIEVESKKETYREPLESFIPENE